MMMKKIIYQEKYGCRIDKFLKDTSDLGMSRNQIADQIKLGNVLVNGKKIKPKYILRENDAISINSKQIKDDNIRPNKNINLDIIFSDENIIAINKPAGLQVHPDFHEKKNTLANALIAKFPEIKNVGEDPMRPGIMHRLDRDTSGIIIVAKNQKVFLELKNKFKAREIEKKYWAIIFGKLEKSGTINKPLARAASYKKQVIAGKKTKTKIREALTRYNVLKTGDNFSLVEVSPKTGRMHQIRVHLASIGHPIVGDDLYKMKNIKTADAPRQMLHAKSIKFSLLGKNYELEAALPQDLQDFLTNID